MPNRTVYAGTVTEVIPDRKAFQIDNRWFQLHPTRSTSPLPEKGAIIRFDGYGERQNVVYKWVPATAPVKEPTPITAKRASVARPTEASARQTALLAAATLCAGIADADERLREAVRAATTFEQWLRV